MVSDPKKMSMQDNRRDYLEIILSGALSVLMHLVYEVPHTLAKRLNCTARRHMID